MKGRLVMNGKPMPGIAVGLVQADRRIRTFVGEYIIATDVDGNFLFSNVVSNQQMYVYGKMESLKSVGAVTSCECETKADGQTVDVGDLQIQPAHTLAGKVVLSDGKSVPEKIRIIISRKKAWDSRLVELAAAGSFHVDGLPMECVDVTVEVPGYRLSEKNANLDKIHGFSLRGVVDRDIPDLVVLLEPGEFVRPDLGEMTGDQQQEYLKPFRELEHKPLEGVHSQP